MYAFGEQVLSQSLFMHKTVVELSVDFRRCFTYVKVARPKEQLYKVLVRVHVV